MGFKKMTWELFFALLQGCYCFPQDYEKIESRVNLYQNLTGIRETEVAILLSGIQSKKDSVKFEKPAFRLATNIEVPYSSTPMQINFEITKFSQNVFINSESQREPDGCSNKKKYGDRGKSGQERQCYCQYFNYIEA